jgi:Sulfotransferase family
MATEPMSPRIAFLIGGRRTGSTLLHNILCGSPDTHRYIGEFQFLTRILDSFRWGHDNFDRLVRFYFRDRDHLDSFQTETIRNLLSEAVTTLAPLRCAILKNPELSAHVHVLAKALPESVFVATVRDPRDQVASEQAVIAKQLKIGLRTGAVPSARDLAAHFQSYYDPLWELQAAQPERITFVKYEDLVSSPGQTIAETCNFLEIRPDGIDPTRKWDFGDVEKVAMKTRPSWTPLFGQPPSTERIGIGSSLLTPTEIREIDEGAAFLGRKFGYRVPAKGEAAK